MKRRAYLTSVGGGTMVLAGCASDSDDSDESDPLETEDGDTPDSTDDTSGENTETESDEEADSEPEHDVVVDYSTHIQSSASGQYDLPEPRHEEWDWLVMDLEVVEGELDMEDAWFNAFFETEERLHSIAHDSGEVIDGIESRGTIRPGGRGVLLHEYPPSPRGELVGWNTSVMDQSIGGEGIITDGPNNLYPPVSVEYSVTTTTLPDVLPEEYAERRSETETWAVVTISVIDGFLNMEDVWFRSQLTTGSRRHELSHSSSHAARGVRSRGIVKTGYSANALYLIGENESVESWGYTDDRRQDVSISER